MDRLDPARTALVLVHMVKGVAGDVDTDGCLSDTDEGHANSIAVIKKWFGETPTADEVLSALK